ncbi:reverse transcriptase domain-containing protein [Tanacetum coccineum]
MFAQNNQFTNIKTILHKNTQYSPRSPTESNQKKAIKPYQPPQARNEHVNAVFTRSGKSYDPPINPNDQLNDYETPINFDSDDEDEESTLQPKSQTPKLVKETPIPKPYKPKILYPQRLRKEKMEAKYGKFLDMIRSVRINVPLVDVLAGMSNYRKFLKELVSNKHKLEQISSAFLSDDSSAMIQNKVPPKLGDHESFLIPCNFSKAFSCNALADLGASINLMPYSLYAKLSLETLKPTQVSVRLADRSFQHPIRIAENMVVEVGSKILYSIEVTILKEKIFAEFDEFMAMTADKNSESDSKTKEPSFEKITFNTDYKIKTSLEEPPSDLELKPLPNNLKYVFLEEPYFLPLLEKDTPFEFNDECHKAFNSLKEKFTCTPVIVSPNWNLPFEFMCDASDFAVGAVLGQKDGKHFHPIYFSSKILIEAQQKYMVTKKRTDGYSLCIRQIPTLSDIIQNDCLHRSLSLRHLFKKQDDKPRLIHWILLLQELDIEIKDKKGIENVAVDHLSRIDNDETSDDNDVDNNFPGETRMEITTNDTPWFADFANYLVGDVIPKGTRYIHGLAPQIRGMIRATQPTTIQSAILKAGTLTDEAVRCGTLTRSSEKRKEVVESSKQGGLWFDNKRVKVGK